MGSDSFGRFPRRRHFHSGLAVSCVATNQMWTKGNRECLIQKLMHGHSAARQGASQFRAFQLPHLVSKADRIISSHHPLMLQGKNQIQIFPVQRDKRSPAFTGFDTETAVELLIPLAETD